MPIVITTTPEVVFEKCALDLVGPFLEAVNGNWMTLMFQDALTKYWVSEPIQLQDAEIVAKSLVQKFILIFGTPQILLSHQDQILWPKSLNECANYCKL